MLPGRECFWNFARCFSCGFWFWVQCFSAYWGLIHENMNGLEEGSQEEGKQGIPLGSAENPGHGGREIGKDTSGGLLVMALGVWLWRHWGRVKI